MAGAVVRAAEDGTRRTYPGGVDYDGYLTFYGRDGALQRSTDFNLGAGDMLAALRWLDEGVIAVGSSGWDRWLGGMSITRGCDPLIVWLGVEAGRSNTDAKARVIPLSDRSRHFHLHDVAVTGGSIAAYGFSDSPMTHSADHGNTAAKTFGALKVSLAP